LCPAPIELLSLIAELTVHDVMYEAPGRLGRRYGFRIKSGVVLVVILRFTSTIARKKIPHAIVVTSRH
jgi:hypothetical protein